MAYFSNGTEGEAFDDQCGKCKYGMEPYPIAMVQSMYNYDAVNNELATKILGELVKDNGECTTFTLMEKDLAVPFVDPNQTSLF